MRRVTAAAAALLAGRMAARAGAVALLLAGVAGIVPRPARAQDGATAVVRSARLTADVRSDASDVEVRVEVVLSGGNEAVEHARIEALGFGPARVDSAHIEAPGGLRPIHLEPETGSMRAGRLEVAPPVAGRGETPLTLVYRVTGAVERSGDEVRVRLPVLVVDLPPMPGGGPVFHASVRLPPEWSVSGGFPTGLAASEEGRWETDLPVVPALVSLRGRSDGAWRPGLPEVLDVAGLLVLLVFGVVGWRHLREVAA